MLMREIGLDIAGLGMILYSPPAVASIPAGSDYLQEHFSQPGDVARHVMACELTTFCTGSPGSFLVRFLDGPPNDSEVQAADFKLRLGLGVQKGTICLRDCYDLMQWSPECPPQQQLPVADGWYRMTVFSSRPASGILGQDQVINIYLEPVANKPQLRWEGVPLLCEMDAG
jgi:hypothetical protein